MRLDAGCLADVLSEGRSQVNVLCGTPKNVPC